MKDNKTKSIIDKFVIGRVLPHIYAFKTNSVPNSLKVGDTYRPISVRLEEWKKKYPNLQKEFEEKATVDNDQKFFRDYSVHYFLENEKNKKRLPIKNFSNIYYSNEFFENTTQKDVKLAIEDIKSNYNKSSKYQFYSMDKMKEVFTYERESDWSLRDNQRAAVNNFKNAVNNGRSNLLMYAVMRFGKSFTAMSCAKEINANIVLIVSAKADVETEWKKAVEKPGNFADYIFLNDESLKDENIIKSTLKENKKCAIFLTLQNLKGENIKIKHKELFENKVDLLIVDETHFGARAEKYGAILKDKKEKRENDCVSEKDEQIIKELNAKIKLHLSGTPYRILMGDEFAPEDIICFCQYSDIIEEQVKWNNENQDAEEWNNPYYGFPQMVRFAFNPNESTRKKLEQLKNNNETYNFSAFFKTKSTEKNVNDLHKQFENEKEVLELLEVIDGSSKNEKLLGFLNYQQIKNGKMCRHMVCVLPYKASCDALEYLIKKNNHKFKNLNTYEIINIAGVDDETKYKTIDSVKTKIQECENDNKKTLTLTVNRMLTGTTVPQWDTMLYFKDTASPQEYDQSIFRLQNQYVVDFSDGNGNKIKYNMKPQTLLVDFDPNRMFRMQEAKAQIYNMNVKKSGNTELKGKIKKELTISPIILVNKDKLSEVKASDVMDVLSEYNKNKGVSDEVQSMAVDMSLMKNKKLYDEISKQPELGSKNGLSFSAFEGEGEDLDVDSLNNNEKQPEEGNAQSQQNTVQEESAEKKFIKQMQTYYARILFFAFLTKDKVCSVEDIISKIQSNNDNKRIAKNLGLKLSVLKILNSMNAFKLSDLDYKVQNINKLANDNTVDPIERAEVAIKKFSRLSTSEIQTPVDICNEMINLISSKDYKKLINNNKKILDIASKSGEFASALFINLSKYCYKNKLRNAIYSIPTSSIAYEFTRKIYDVLGLNINNISEKFTSYDLLYLNSETNEIDYDVIAKKLTQNKKFNEIDIKEENIKGGKNMMFDVVVGNPPYQDQGGSGGNNDAPIYQHFSMIANALKPCFSSLIIKAGWFSAGRENLLGDFRKYMLKCNNVKNLVTYKDSSLVFGDNVEIKGGVCYYLIDKNHKGDCLYSLIDEKNNKETTIRTLGDFDILIREPILSEIVKKVMRDNQNNKCVDSIISSDTPFGIPSNPKNSKKTPFPVYVNKTKEHNTLLYHIENNKRKIEYVSRNDIKKNLQAIDKFKVFIPGAGGSGNDPYVIGKPESAPNNSVCSQSYLYSAFDTQIEANNFKKYLNTKFFRVLVKSIKITQSAPSRVYRFVPMQNFTSNSDIDWSKSITEIDTQLYNKYNLEETERAFIEKMIKPME